MSSWISNIPLYGLAAISVAAIVAAGAIAVAAESSRRRLQSKFDELGGESKRQEVQRIEEELETKRQQLGELEKQHTEAKQLLSNTDQLRSEIAELERARDALGPLRQELETARREQQALASQVDQARTALAEAETRSRVAEQAAVAADVRQQEAEARHGSIETELQKAREELRPLQIELDENRSGLRDIVRKAKDAQAVIDRAEEYERKTAEVEKIRAVLDAAQEALEAANAELADSRLRLAEAEEKETRSIARHEALERAAEELGGAASNDADITVLRTRTADVWKHVFDPDRSSTGSTSEETCLGLVQKYLQDHELIFHERTVYSFHTALKVAREAPLLALAGISGTGKSLLPQRYAEAMGMNFLLVPVQPRWDGPQDLLGFYNFLQEKCVATEFLRALVQMHPYPDEWHATELLQEDSEHKSLADQMMLVLLDEMNLARVEYYFSEFLSRLEIRRTITNEGDAKQRRKASIPIDAGPLPSGLDAPMVYPGPNTLFVGTMNEDESKQSLSDMVVDRANIMRFSRPKGAAPSGTGSPPSPPNGRLSHATWKKWIGTGSLSAPDRERIASVTEELNDALFEIDRPFGFRLGQAMQKYAELYPAHAPDRVNFAIADQIEMRILPKLRGIELDERATAAVSQIQSIIVKTGDTELAAAVDNATHDRASGRFHWFGLSRSTD